MEISHLWELICVGEVKECLEDRLAHILDVHVPLLPFPHWAFSNALQSQTGQSQTGQTQKATPDVSIPLPATHSLASYFCSMLLMNDFPFSKFSVCKADSTTVMQMA